MTASWLTTFVDLPESDFDEGVRFWSSVTGTTASAGRGTHEEFLSLLPPDGDDWLRLQRLGSGSARFHVDVHVPDPQSCAAHAVHLGCSVVADLGYVVMQAPGGLTFCFVSHPAETRPGPVLRERGGRRWAIRPLQLCLDLPPAVFDRRNDVVAAVLGVTPSAVGELRSSSAAQRYAHVDRDLGALGLVAQRLDAGTESRIHLDLATTDRAAESEFQVGLGAEVVQEFDAWTIMRGPGGLAHCIVDEGSLG